MYIATSISGLVSDYVANWVARLILCSASLRVRCCWGVLVWDWGWLAHIRCDYVCIFRPLFIIFPYVSSYKAPEKRRRRRGAWFWGLNSFGPLQIAHEKWFRPLENQSNQKRLVEECHAKFPNPGEKGKHGRTLRELQFKQVAKYDSLDHNTKRLKEHKAEAYLCIMLFVFCS